MEHQEYSLGNLKKLGHALLNEYVALEWRRNKSGAKARAYEKLGRKLGTTYGRQHFSKMKTRAEVIAAIAALRHMIHKRKEVIEWRGEQKALPLAEQKKALAELQANKETWMEH